MFEIAVLDKNNVNTMVSTGIVNPFQLSDDVDEFECLLTFWKVCFITKRNKSCVGVLIDFI